eukprot:m.276421 g.276421  ORF g.276421 m.276421 type:complete len:213 (+) comp15713_c0_seq13:1122-1760(+)
MLQSRMRALELQQRAEMEQMEQELQRKQAIERERREEQLRLKEEKEAREAEQRHLDMVEARVRAGMSRTIAEGRSQEERMVLSHTGTWKPVKTHYNSQAVGMWAGCCLEPHQYTWCTLFKGPVGPDDQAAFDTHQRQLIADKAEAEARVTAGMPSAVAIGKTKQLRMKLSHTQNLCPGEDVCGTKVRAELLSQVLVVSCITQLCCGLDVSDF